MRKAKALIKLDEIFESLRVKLFMRNVKRAFLLLNLGEVELIV